MLSDPVEVALNGMESNGTKWKGKKIKKQFINIEKKKARTKKQIEL